MGIEFSDDPPEGWEPRETPWDTPAFAGWGSDVFGRSTEGVRLGSRAWVLVPGPGMTVDEEGLLSTSAMTISMTTGLEDPPPVYGFRAQDPDNNPDTWEGGGLGVAGFRGEGMRGGAASTTGTGEDETFVGEAQYAGVFDEDTTASTIEHGTMGIGFLELTTYNDGDTNAENLYFNYSNIGSEPKFRAVAADIDMGDTYISYQVNNPFDYAEEESISLRQKFGWDTTLGTGEYENPIKDGFNRSINKIVEAIITTYPIDLATFPRTPPLKLRKKNFQLLRKEEELQDDDPLGIEALTSTISGDMESESGPSEY